MDSAAARELFDRNARTYDAVNLVVSFGMTGAWYGWAADQAVVGPGARVLDAFSGSGAVGIRAARRGACVTLADVSPRMLKAAALDAKRAGVDVALLETDLTARPLDLPGAPFDAITAMWGTRYVDDPSAVLHGLAEQLTPEGRLVLVDFVEPSDGFVSRAASVYFFRVVPAVGTIVSGSPDLYRELVATTHRMGPASRLRDMVERAGLRVAQEHAMGFGLVRGIVATRA